MKTYRYKLLLLAFTLLFIHISLNAQTSDPVGGFGIPRLINRHSETRTSNSNNELSFLTEHDAVQRYQEVQLSGFLSLANSFQQGDKIAINFFPDRDWIAVIEKINRNRNNTLSLRCKIDDMEYAYLIVSITEGIAYVSADVPELGEYFKIIWDNSAGKYFLLQMDPALMGNLEDDAPLIADIQAATSTKKYSPKQAETERSGPLDPASIAIMILYTPTALNWANTNASGINNLLAQIMTKSQLVLDNSQTYIAMNLVYSGPVDYTECGNATVDLVRLATSPVFLPEGESLFGYPLTGYMDEIHAIRNIFGADLVVFLEYIPSPGGMSWLLETTDGMPDYAFSLVRVQQATNYTPIHEMGHLMGASHHKAQNYQPGPGLFSYSAGWRWVGTGGSRYCSVMTYEAGTYFTDGLSHSRVPYFSSPGISYQSIPTGDAVDGDNARTLLETKHIVAAYKTADFPEPINISIVRSGADVHILWDSVPYANSYKVWSATTPNAPNNEWTLVSTVSTNQFSETSQAERFYRVVASSAAP